MNLLFHFLFFCLVSLSFRETLLESGHPDHALWTGELKKYVSNDGKVNYAAWSKNTAGIEKYLQQLSSHPVQNDWTRNEKLAYWINAYNAYTIKLILDHYPVKSIRDLHNGNPWDVSWIKLGYHTYSLNQIENQIIRPQFNEARVHFALNCGAKSCPPLLNEAYNPAELESQLFSRTKNFINNPGYTSYSDNVFKISQIFNWYQEDFNPDVLTFILKYMDHSCPVDSIVEYQPYDWNLNEE